MLIKLKKAQSTAEYAILISVIIGAAIAMQVYIMRSLQAKMHDAGLALTSVTGDITGGGITLGTTKQYEPYYVSSYSRMTTTRDDSEKTVEVGGAATSSTTREYDLETMDITATDVEE